MKTIVKWFAGFFEDQVGTASSKRLTLYGAMYFLWMLVAGSLQNKTVDQMVLFTVAGIILFCIGAVTSEFFKGTGIFK